MNEIFYTILAIAAVIPAMFLVCFRLTGPLWFHICCRVPSILTLVLAIIHFLSVFEIL